VALTKDRADALVEQVAAAHRMAVGFYQRLLPQLDDMARSLDLDFWYWEPLETGKPCRSTTAPSANWAWDMVPLYAATYVYRRLQGDRARKGDAALQFCVYLDTAFDSDERKRHGITGEPDPLTLPRGRSEVQMFLARCTADDPRHFDVLWKEADESDPLAKGWQKLHAKMEARAITCGLADLLVNPDVVVADLKRYLNK
jgi:hypothetical protein